jgi:hypothetical protein
MRVKGFSRLIGRKSERHLTGQNIFCKSCTLFAHKPVKFYTVKALEGILFCRAPCRFGSGLPTLAELMSAVNMPDWLHFLGCDAALAAATLSVVVTKPRLPAGY